MKYKLIVCDFDGTLDHPDIAQVGQRTKDAIKNYFDNGGTFCVSTGRSWDGLKHNLPHYGLDKYDVPMTCCNGGVCYSGVSEQILFENRVPMDVSQKFLAQLDSQDIYVQIYKDDHLYTKQETKWTERYAGAVKVDIKSVGNLVEFLKNKGVAPHKFVIIDEPQNILEYQKTLAAQYPELSFVLSNDILLEVFSARSGKGNAAQVIADMLSIPMSQVVCIGDSQNDISMLQMAGLGVAMGNARDDVKAVAKHITDSVQNQGVAQVIEDIIAGKL